MTLSEFDLLLDDAWSHVSQVMCCFEVYKNMKIWLHDSAIQSWWIDLSLSFSRTRVDVLSSLERRDEMNSDDVICSTSDISRNDRDAIFFQWASDWLSAKVLSDRFLVSVSTLLIISEFRKKTFLKVINSLTLLGVKRVLKFIHDLSYLNYVNFPVLFIISILILTNIRYWSFIERSCTMFRN